RGTWGSPTRSRLQTARFADRPDLARSLLTLMQGFAILLKFTHFALPFRARAGNIRKSANCLVEEIMVFTRGRRKWLKERVRRLFGGLPRRVQVAALPWRLTEKGDFEILLVTSRGTGRWVLPKGWPEKREEPYEAAAREAAEEAGVSGGISRRPIGTYLYQKKLDSGMEWGCEVSVFPLEVDEVADKWPERKKRKRRWFAPRYAARLVDEPDISELIGYFAANPRQSAA